MTRTPRRRRLRRLHVQRAAPERLGARWVEDVQIGRRLVLLRRGRRGAHDDAPGVAGHGDRHGGGLERKRARFAAAPTTQPVMPSGPPLDQGFKRGFITLECEPFQQAVIGIRPDLASAKLGLQEMQNRSNGRACHGFVALGTGVYTFVVPKSLSAGP
jgi:hypothetical protein